MHTLWQDVRYGARLLAKSPGFTAIAVMTLALGIGANTAIFSLMHQVLLRRLPVRNSNELVLLRSPGPITGHGWSDGDIAESFSYPMYKGLRERNTVLSGLLARFAFPASVATHDQTERAFGELVSGNYFEVLGVRPALGRVFSQEDDRVPGAHPLVVLSYGYWTRRFAGSPAVLNQTILVNNTRMTIVGVSQPGFTGIQVGESADVFVPFLMKEQMLPNWSAQTNGHGFEDWNDYYIALLARLRPGVSREQAEAGITETYRPLLEEQLPTIKGWNEEKRQKFLDKKILLFSGSRGRLTLQRDSQDPLIVLGAMAALVLLIACANVANLLIARGAARGREFAIRAALGASRWRTMRQLLVESLLCAALGGMLGLVVASWTMDLLIPTVVSGAGIEGLSTRLNGSLLLFALGATAFSGMLFGLVPAWRLARTSVSQSLKDQGSNASAGMGHVRFRKFLVAAQVAFTMLLLAGAGLYARTLFNLRHLELGLRAENLLSFSIQPELNGYSNERAIVLFDQLRERLAALPGVSAVGASKIPTLTGSTTNTNITVPGAETIPQDERRVSYDSVSPGYFSTLGAPLLSGREFTAGDSTAAPKVAIISEAMAHYFFPNRSPIGERFAFGGGKVTPDIQIVGVVKDVRQNNVRSPIGRYVYIPYAQTSGVGSMTFYVRTQQDPLLLSNTLRSEVRQLDANLPVYHVKTMQHVVDDDLLGERMVAGLSVSFGVLAALLAALGIYGVLAYTVAQRTQEIGVRMALGAEPRHVRFLIVREVGFMVLAGAVVGLPAAYGLARVSESLLFGVRATDLVVYATDLALIAFVALAACYLPARRATRVDPIVALRYE
jgi:predicted permease